MTDQVWHWRICPLCEHWEGNVNPALTCSTCRHKEAGPTRWTPIGSLEIWEELKESMMSRWLRNLKSKLCEWVALVVASREYIHKLWIQERAADAGYLVVENERKIKQSRNRM